ncbi:MAG: hypothetical protein HZC28_03370 [Spirochaetes bacterium]|nr:hypothetical protein [Spirochaetota bacterium]
MALTETMNREFAQRILNVLTTNADTLKAAGVDVSGRIEVLKGMVTEAFDAENTQIRMTADLRNTTARSRKSAATAYDAASGVLNLIVGTIGRNDALSRELRMLRTSMSRVKSAAVTEAAKAEKRTA